MSIERIDNLLVTDGHTDIGLPCNSFCHFITKSNVGNLYRLSFRSLDSWQQIRVRTNQNNFINHSITRIDNNIHRHTHINTLLLHT